MKKYKNFKKIQEPNLLEEISKKFETVEELENLKKIISEDEFTKILTNNPNFMTKIKELFKSEINITPTDSKIKDIIYNIENVLKNQNIIKYELNNNELEMVNGGTSPLMVLLTDSFMPGLGSILSLISDYFKK